MLSKELFIRMMKTAEKFSAEVDRWNDFGIDVFELPIGELPWDMFSAWYESHFTPEGQDWITWYLWERKSYTTGEILPCYDEKGNEFYVNDLEHLWTLVESLRIKPCTDQPCAYYKNCKK